MIPSRFRWSESGITSLAKVVGGKAALQHCIKSGAGSWWASTESAIAGPQAVRLLRVVCKDTVFSWRLYFGLTVQGSVISERAEP